MIILPQPPEELFRLVLSSLAEVVFAHASITELFPTRVDLISYGWNLGDFSFNYSLISVM